MAQDDPIFQQAALHALDNLKSRFEAGDEFALLTAIRKCANFNIVMPEWVASAYIARYDRVHFCQVDSWDKAFGRPYPKGVHVGKLRRRLELRFDVYNRIRKVLTREPDTPIDDGLFEKVGADVGIGKTFCKELYYQAARLAPLSRQISKTRGNT